MFYRCDICVIVVIHDKFFIVVIHDKFFIVVIHDKFFIVFYSHEKFSGRAVGF